MNIIWNGPPSLPNLPLSLCPLTPVWRGRTLSFYPPKARILPRLRSTIIVTLALPTYVSPWVSLRVLRRAVAFRWVLSLSTPVR